MDLTGFTSIYPTLFFFWGYCLFLLLMIISFISGFLGDIDLPFTGDADLNSDAFSLLDIIFPQRLGQLPLLACLSIVFFIATVISFLIQDFLMLLTGILYWITGTITLLLILFISLHITNIILKPFDRFFSQKHAFATVNYIGMTGRIKTTRVDQNFGEIAILDHSGREDYLNIYCDTQTHNIPLKYGDLALIIAYNETLKRYLVIKADEKSSNITL